LPGILGLAIAESQPKSVHPSGRPEHPPESRVRLGDQKHPRLASQAEESPCHVSERSRRILETGDFAARAGSRAPRVRNVAKLRPGRCAL